jgi:hypothetical protein
VASNVDIAQAREERIRQDLSAFADPETEIVVTTSRSALEARWEQGNRPRSATFLFGGDGRIKVREGRTETGYRAFFAGPSMADIDALALGARRLHRFEEAFVEGEARLPDQDETGRALGVVSAAIGDPFDAGATRMVFVRADAGVGKTTTLRQLCVRGADEHLSRRRIGVHLYIDAQGRGLRRLDEAIAVALDDLRSSLTYHAVPALTRLGLLIPVIDGFDELVGASGTFDAAFDSLTAFVERLEGRGVFVASARSAYYEREFVSRVDREADRAAAAWDEVAVELLPWRSREVSAYLAARKGDIQAHGISLDEMETYLSGLFSGANEALSGKPFFVARIVDERLAADIAPDAGEGTDLLALLVAQYVSREARGKLRSPETGAVFVTEEQLLDFFAEIAEVMWTLETRELAPDDVEETAAAFAEFWEVTPAEGRLFAEKSTSLAFLSRSAAQRVSFEHPLFFGYFLARRLPMVIGDVEKGESAAALATVLGRSALPEGAGPPLAQALLGEAPDADRSSDRARQLLALLSEAGRVASFDAPRVRENAGHIAAGVLQAARDGGGALEGAELRHLVFAGDDLRCIRLIDALLETVDFRRTDLRGSRVSGSARGLLTFVDVQLDADTELIFDNPDSVLLLSATFAGKEVHTGTELLRVADAVKLRGRGEDVVPQWEVTPEVLERMERLARHFRRSNMAFADDDYVGPWISDGLGQRIMTDLVEADVVRLEHRSKAGPPTSVYRLLVSGEEVARSLGGPSTEALDERIVKAWRLLEKENDAGR